MSLAVTIEYHEAPTLEEWAEMMRTVVLSPDLEDALRWPDADAECFEGRAVQPSDASRCL